MKTLVTISVLAIFGVAASGQTSFLGLLPGKSTRSAVEQALGSPVKNVTAELAEYKLPQKTYKIYAQYRNGTPEAIVQRIELTCQNCDTFAGYELYDLTGVLRDASSSKASDTGRVLGVDYYGAALDLSLRPFWRRTQLPAPISSDGSASIRENFLSRRCRRAAQARYSALGKRSADE